MQAGWCTLGELKTTVTRPEVLECCEWLDAVEGAAPEPAGKLPGR